MSDPQLLAFSEHLDRYGPELSAWPTEARAEGERLLESHADAARLLEQARQLDDLLRELPSVAASADLKRRVLAARPGGALETLLDWFGATLWRPALAASVPLLLGFVVGLLQPDPMDEDLAGELSLLALSAQFEELGYEE